MGRRLKTKPSVKRGYNKQGLTDEQQNQIRELADGTLTVPQIVQKVCRVRTGYSLVYAFVVRENLTVKFLPGTKAESQIRQKLKSNEFFYADEKNWY